MARRLFFAELLPAAVGPSPAPRQAVVRGPEARHLMHVLRAKRGMEMELAAEGARYLGVIVRLSDDAVIFDLDPAPAPAPAPAGPRLIAALFKFDRFEWMLEKATELGVAEIQPLAASRSDPRLVRAAASRQDRWRRLLRSAAQQSRRADLPGLLPTARWHDIGAPATEACRIVLSEDAGAPSLAVRLASRAAGPVTLAVGPEGGWTEADSAAAQTLGFLPAALGPRILRAETAAIAALACLLAIPAAPVQ